MLPEVEIYKMLIDGSQWGQWHGYHLPISAACPTTWTPAGTAMHWRPATWTAENHAVAFFWPGRWYVIHAFYDRAGLFAGCYCDIVTPNPLPMPKVPTMRYTDLYVDVVVRADRSVFTKDHEVFGRAMQVVPALADLHDQAFRELDALEAHARAWSGPFAPVVERLMRTDWEMLDPASAEFAAARDAQWNGFL
jgi:protein associated with RNAse G/E